ncbi:MAG: 3-dehydroquinate synthase [Spirochaetaceae bacterium]|nr:MAG: 3-dehydroquinate synthase [Spirochaetaceae bacterium]
MSEYRYSVGADTTTVVLSRATVAELLDADAGHAAAALLVADRNTIELCRDYAGPRIVLPAGEDAKQWSSIAAIVELALTEGVSRDGRMIGVGGGAVCDVAAFAASIYMRGISLTLVPTTLLAMVDAAFGGKTGINFHGYKNMVGTFYPAARLLVAPSALHSLPPREFQSGMAEVIKSAMLGDAELFDFLEREHAAVVQRRVDALHTIVQRSLAVKAAVVERDFTELGIRAWLNLGHTFGHALESVAGFGRYTHGEAVAWGMACALDLGVALGITEPDYAARARMLIERYGFVLQVEGIEVDALLQAMQHDKKVRSGTLRFVLQRGLTQTELAPVAERTVRAVLRARIR